jgi:hypothetical protein
MPGFMGHGQHIWKHIHTSKRSKGYPWEGGLNLEFLQLHFEMIKEDIIDAYRILLDKLNNRASFKNPS